MKVRIKKLPHARTGYQVRGGLVNDVPAMGGADYNAYIGEPNMKVSKTLTAVPREDANLEAEGGETVIGNIDGSNMPSFYDIKGPRHTNGGVPLNLPDDSFIFSDTKSMIIKDPSILKMFGVKNNKSYTPAELSKKYDVNKYRVLLQDPNSDKITRKTAEMMIKNYTIKLGALALAQESKKGFPQGIPVIAKPYMEAMGISEEDLIPKEEAPEQPQEQMSQGEEGVGPEQKMPMNMPNGEPVAQPQEMSEEMPKEMMRYGGMRRLRRAQEGMQQDQSQELMQQVSQALEQGSDPQEVTASLLQNQIPPETIMQMFVQLGMPEEQVQEVVITTMQQMQDSQSQQQPISEEEMMAMQQQAPEEMQEAPMAMYGMNMGGYDMPFYNDPNEMEYGGLVKYQDKGEVVKGGGKTALTKEQLKEKAKRDAAKKVSKVEEGYEDIGDGYYARGSVNKNAGEKKKFKNVKRTQPYVKPTKQVEQQYLDGVCQRMKTGNLQNYTAAELAGKFFDKSLVSKMQACETKTGTEEEEIDVVRLEDEPEIVSNKKKCECTDPETGEVSVFEIETDEDCMCGEDEIVTEQVAGAPPRQNPKWWLQDTVNTMGAFGELMGVQKQMPWEARVDLEEPRPTFLDPTRELAAQSEQANIAAQAAGQFAGPQAQGARLSAIQGQGAAQAANTLSNINNQNVNIANQFEGQQVGIRNQEQMLNQQMANRLYDKNTIANQQFQNAKTAGRANMRQAYNTALTNRAKTDAMNQMYPNYQVDPSTGGMVAYTPTEKEGNPGEDEQEMTDYVNSISGYDPKIQAKLLELKFGKKLGGAIFANGGFVYTDNIFPYLL